MNSLINILSTKNCRKLREKEITPKLKEDLFGTNHFRWNGDDAEDEGEVEQWVQLGLEEEEALKGGVDGEWDNNSRNEVVVDMFPNWFFWGFFPQILKK